MLPWVKEPPNVRFTLMDFHFCLFPSLGPVIAHYFISFLDTYFNSDFYVVFSQQVGPTYLVYHYQKYNQKSSEVTILDYGNDLLMSLIFPHPSSHLYSAADQCF